MSKFRRLFVLGLVACFGCEGNDDTPGMSTGGGGSSAGASACGESRAALVHALEGPASCEQDEECTAYSAPCLREESGNCAGIFYTNASSLDAVDARQAEYEECVGHACGGGGVCGLGPHNPTCVDGACR